MPISAFMIFSPRLLAFATGVASPAHLPALEGSNFLLTSLI
jgi:hypothetical protein